MWSRLVQLRSNYALKRSQTWAACSSALAVSWLAASSALAAPPNTMPIWRVQVRFITANVDDAGTDSNVWIKLNGGNTTYIDSGRDDRERGNDETYELRLDGVSTLADLDFFQIQKDGDDGWAISRMFLIVNNEVIYDESFPSALWLDNEGGASRIRFTDDTYMRARSNWINYATFTRPNIVPVGDMNARVEALEGDFTSLTTDLSLRETGHTDAYMNAISVDTWQVHVDLTEKNVLWIGQDINVDFKMKVGCTSGSPTFTVSSVNASSTYEPWTTNTRADAQAFVNGDFKPRLNQMMKGFHFSLCPTIGLAPNGDLHLSSRFDTGGYVISGLYGKAALDLFVDTGDGIKTFTPTNYTATVASRLKGDTKAQLTFQLPTAIAAYDAVVEVQPLGAKGTTRKLKADLKQSKDDTSVLTFADVLAAGQTVQYTLHLVYQPKDEGKGSIVTTIQPLDPEVQKQITPVKSSTDFSFIKGEVVPMGTSTTASHNVGDTEVWTPPKPADKR